MNVLSKTSAPAAIIPIFTQSQAEILIDFAPPEVLEIGIETEKSAMFDQLSECDIQYQPTVSDIQCQWSPSVRNAMCQTDREKAPWRK